MWLVVYYYASMTVNKHGSYTVMHKGCQNNSSVIGKTVMHKSANEVVLQYSCFLCQQSMYIFVHFFMSGVMVCLFNII
jgi:hypothetical protein